MPTRRAWHAGWRGLLPLLVVAALLAALAAALVPPLCADARALRSLPRDAAGVRALYAALHAGTQRQPARAAAAFAAVYTLLQTFSVPGSVGLSLLGGALFGAWRGTALVALASATGASGAFWLSRCVLRGVLARHAAARVARVRQLVAAQLGAAQLAAVVALRVTPLLPNWLINVAAPHAGVPLATFWLGSALGVVPPTLFFARAGAALHSLAGVGDALDARAVVSLFALGALTLVPALPPVQRRLRAWLERPAAAAAAAKRP